MRCAVFTPRRPQWIAISCKRNLLQQFFLLKKKDLELMSSTSFWTCPSSNKNHLRKKGAIFDIVDKEWVLQVLRLVLGGDGLLRGLWAVGVGCGAASTSLVLGPSDPRTWREGGGGTLHKRGRRVRQLIPLNRRLVSLLFCIAGISWRIRVSTRPVGGIYCWFQREPKRRNKVGWQQNASRTLKTKFLNEHVWPGMTDAEKKPFLGLNVANLPPLQSPRPHHAGHENGWSTFPCLFLRRLRLPLPLSSRTLPMWLCSAAGVLCRGGFSLEAAGAHVTTNVSVHAMDLAAFDVMDSRRLEVVADGLTTFHVAQLAIDTKLVFALRRDGKARQGAAARAGVALAAIRRNKEKTYPELTGEEGKAGLVDLAAKVGGLWSAETSHFHVALSNAKAKSVPDLLRGRVAAAWLRRWNALLVCSAVKAFASSLLGRKAPGCGDNIPSEAEVVRMTGSREFGEHKFSH